MGRARQGSLDGTADPRGLPIAKREPVREAFLHLQRRLHRHQPADAVRVDHGAAVAHALVHHRLGPAGDPLDEVVGFSFPFSVWGVVLANTFVAMPFLVVTVEGALSSLDGRHEGAAASLGASPLTVFRRVTLPMIAPSLRAGAVLAWARAFGEFGATVTFAGNLQGRTQTLPLAVFVSLDSNRDAAIAISLLMVAVSIVVLMALRSRWWSRAPIGLGS